jgi:hypothetical protein
MSMGLAVAHFTCHLSLVTCVSTTDNMAKRGAEDQLTKDDVEGGRSDAGEDEVEQVRKDASREALAGRQ